MNTFWSIVIGVSIGILLFFLCLLVKFCFFNERNRQNLKKESESGLQRTTTPLLQRDLQFEGSSQFNVESEFRTWNKSQRNTFDRQFESPLKDSYSTKLEVENQSWHRKDESEAVPKKSIHKKAVPKKAVPKKAVPKKAVPKKTVPKKTVLKKVLELENQNKHRTKKSKALSFPKPQTHISDKKVLKVKRLDKVKVPNILRMKHISKPPVTQKIAKDLSKKRKQKIFTNTVFEDPKGLIHAKVLNSDWKKGREVFVSEKKLITFQCKKNQKTSDWTTQKLEPRHALFAKNFHLLSEFREYDEVNFVCDVEE